MNNMPYIFFIILSAFTMNLVLQCGLGINAGSKASCIKTTSIKLGIIFLTSIALWSIFSGIIASIFSGIYIYILLFPAGFMVYEGLEYLVFHRILKKDHAYMQEIKKQSVGFPGGITAAALFICMIVANNFIEALALSFGFSLGALIVFLILSEIRKRAALEAVPRFLRGKPLVLISMGLLSLVFSKASILLFGMIGS